MFIYILIVVAILLVLSVIILYNYSFSQIVLRKPLTTEEMYKFVYDNKEYKKDDFDKLKKEEVTIKTSDGLMLKGYYIYGNKDKEKTVILVHGITVGIPWSFKYMDMFLKRGYNVLIYDQRRHGESEGKYSTYGYYEKEDLKLWTDFVRRKNGSNAKIGLHGESMGAATVLQYAKVDSNIDFIIADCGFSSLPKLLNIIIKKSHVIPFPVLQLSSHKAKRLAGFKYDDVKPIEVVRNTNIPIMFIHGLEDDFIPYSMSVEMYEAKKGLKALYLAKGAKHACSVKVDKDKYEREVNEFLNKVYKNE